MTSLTAGDVVWVPFPYVEANRRRSRPAVVLASAIGADTDLLWVLMVTNAARTPWPGDVPIADHAALGLPIASKVRTAKIAVVEARAARHLGRLPEAEWAEVRNAIAAILDSHAKLPISS
jgi:mRNA interferase MazF